ncbi:hypothetical protein PLESTB_001287200 [Pleodorina starrii]|uniref:Uncharacterized protein n=1 Tax=Pleodorina starrii TaxID=330485 RepID=A0A9W6BTF0_9CHLO|nr:hypothetical protein PLESTM_000832400 [Pleodorina starrii]GLC57902.1 hypothetical protein PLESTB_001287200 [Pleodorina starrii]GLC67108.1 hypothetical protein PLESTF_000516200 [Pleodorina starrii]
MDALSLAVFEERAANAESRLAALEALVASGGVTDSAALLELRSLLVKAKEETTKLQEERDKAVSERKALEDEVAKLKYQVMHLKRSVREVEGQSQATAAAAR